jgi:hypothetical protein
MAEYEIYHLESAPLGENDEYWTLIVPESGSPSIRYDAFWGDPYRGKTKRPPPTVTSLRQFLAEHTFGKVHDNLIALLQELRVAPDA